MDIMEHKCMDSNKLLNDRKEKIGDIPIRILYKGDLQAASQNGCILFYHGLGASKDIQSKELVDLANSGFLAVGVDNVGHGDRVFADFKERFSENNPERVKNIVSAVSETASEINILINWLTDRQILQNNKLGIVGISMGAFIAYAIPMFDNRFKTMVAILGSPLWQDSPESPHNKITFYSKLSLLSLNAAKDNIVPAEHAKEFHLKLKNKYSDYEKRFKYIEYPNSGHFMEEDEWYECWNECLKWFKNRMTLSFASGSQ